ncbi:opine dehydrogenase [Steroidobacter denitrificans]|uniref:Opine dehydrogenase n=1 Tax=Steroidobacter denitrificans TaxID=465721 RepID=A0A127F9W0_STEDE|nr:NAD/NADP-dependent octopine/nopaline dehydrogenase family protein [Steroidobacter denitrificans]AMN46421.1 opine dehydrogenase [Steroidobacter denitrificans]
MGQPITVLGAGSSGLATAAHLALSGQRVRLWNRSATTLGQALESKKILSIGAVAGRAKLEGVTTDIRDAIGNSKILMVTTPANAHIDIARLVAPHVSSSMKIILNPGRTFGALEFAHALRQLGMDRLPTIAETQTIIYTCRKLADDSVTILKLKQNVLISTLGQPEETQRLVSSLPECLRAQFVATDHWVRTSLGNVGMILHCLPTLLNVGWIECSGAEFKYYYDGITPSIAALAERLDGERLSVARHMGCEVESIIEWFRRTYAVAGNNLFECIRNNEYYRTIDAPTSLGHRYLSEDVPCGLVPLEALGTVFGLPMRITKLAIDLASNLMNVDFRAQGRNLDRLGLGANSMDEIRTLLLRSG